MRKVKTVGCSIALSVALALTFITPSRADLGGAADGNVGASDSGNGKVTQTIVVVIPGRGGGSREVTVPGGGGGAGAGVVAISPPRPKLMPRSQPR